MSNLSITKTKLEEVKKMTEKNDQEKMEMGSLAGSKGGIRKPVEAASGAGSKGGVRKPKHEDEDEKKND
ncbi:hypothetical protein KAJ61_02195 [Candidatus Parcubacteria bacterium]|nr:hypothetical protein [Candidatus Parcubacteria bacterium]